MKLDPTLKAIRPNGINLHSAIGRTDQATAADFSAPAPVAAVAVLAVAADAAVSFAVPFGLCWTLSPGGVPEAAVNAAVLLAVLVGAFGAGTGSYRHGGLLHPRRQTRAAIGSAALAVAVTGLSMCLFHVGDQPTRSAMLPAAVLTPLAVAAVRTMLAALLANDAKRRFAPRTLLIGAGDHGRRLLAQLQAANDRAVRLIGYADDHLTRLPIEAGGIAHIGSIEQALGTIGRGNVDQVIVALPWSAEERMLRLLRQLAAYPVHVRLAPDLIQYHYAGTHRSEVAGLPLLHLVDRPISGTASLLKRGEDLLLGSLGLLVLAIPMLLIAAAVRLETPGPALFRQRRTGFNNQEFEMLKFRTMVAAESAEPGLRQTTRDDPRVTRVGAILRRASLDELPQLFNVMRGEMSVVGPRPHAPGTRAGGRPFEQVVSSYAARHRVRPGVTGLAQVRGLRGETETEAKLIKRVESDLEYIEQWSIWLDLTILFRTAAAVVSMRNAY